VELFYLIGLSAISPHRRDAEYAENIFSWSDFLRGKIRPNHLPLAEVIEILNIALVIGDGNHCNLNFRLSLLEDRQLIDSWGVFVFRPLNGKQKKS
jgi:hypothetical protein